jgi:hypothetical protein
MAAVILLLVYSFSAIQLSELVKLKALVHHYYETRQNDDPNISFFEFMVMHYVTDDGNSKDNDRDSELPFKSNHNIVANSATTFILNRFEVILRTPVAAAKEDRFNYDTPFLSSNFYDLVWNPPRLS